MRFFDILSSFEIGAFLIFNNHVSRNGWSYSDKDQNLYGGEGDVGV